VGAGSGRGEGGKRGGLHRAAEAALTAYAEHDFQLSKTDKKGVTLRAHLQQVKKATGKTPKGLVGPPFPTRYEYLWRYFTELHSGRTYGPGGPNPLTWEGIAAWDRLMSAGLKDWEIRAIKALDLLWLRILNEDETHD
jgi:hypothetical protein